MISNDDGGSLKDKKLDGKVKQNGKIITNANSPSLAPGFEASTAKQRGQAACKSTLCSGTLSLNDVKSNFLPLRVARNISFD
jgi:hypothetical protein